MSGSLEYFWPPKDAVNLIGGVIEVIGLVGIQKTRGIVEITLRNN